MAKILVTGGAGFIGSHLVERLLALGHAVEVVDDFNDYYAPAIKRKNTRGFADRIKIHVADIRSPEAMRGIFRDFCPEIVYNLAARAGVRPSIAEPLLYESTNCYGLLVLLELAREFGVRKFLSASSSSVYGNNEKVPFSEDDDVSRPISPYAATKKAGELYCHNYYHLYGLPSVSLRFFTVYGPRQRPDMAIHKFTRMVMNGEEIPMFGDGTTERDYTYYSDIVDGLVGLLDWDFGYEILNLGDSRVVRLDYLIELIGKVVGKTPRIRRMPLQPGDVLRTYADIGKAKRALGYEPKFPIEEGVRIFYDWLKEEE